MTDTAFIAEVKDRVSMVDLFQSVGCKLIPAGTDTYKCLSPFGKERTPSCMVHEDEKYFKCFSSGYGGDCFVFYQKYYGTEFPEALKALAAFVGLSEDTYRAPARASVPRRAEPKEEMAPPWDEYEQWEKACDRVKRGGHVERIAQWRGFRPETVEYLAAQRLMGLWTYYDRQRDSFIIDRPKESEEGYVPVGCHIRMEPGTKGNKESKASWRYCPKGIGSWPFRMGDTATARVIIVFEGQWDAIAFFDLMEWKTMPKQVALIGMRGATSWKKFLRYYRFQESCVLVAFPDSDAAGGQWFSENGFLMEAEEKFSRVVTFMPTAPGCKDFNDLHKQGEVDREMFGWELNQLIPRPRKEIPTFLQWCKDQAQREDDVGRGALHVVEDKSRPKGRARKSVWQGWWRDKPSEIRGYLEAAYEEYSKA